MGRTPVVLALYLVLAASTRSLAQESITSQRPNLAEVRFGDGSIVRHDAPARKSRGSDQVRQAHHTASGSSPRGVPDCTSPADVNTQINNSIKRLASDVYKERDNASKDLVQVGHFAFPMLQRASRSSDQEVAYRAVSLIKQISERVSPELLKLREEDVITTAEFTVIGKITSPTIKANSPHFGDVNLKLSELRTLHMRQQGGKLELVVDAAKHGSGLDQWCDTGIVVDAGQRIVVNSDGSVDLWPQGPGQYMAAPKGYNTAGKGGQFMAGALIARVGESGKPFYVGDRYEGIFAGGRSAVPADRAVAVEQRIDRPVPRAHPDGPRGSWAH